MKKINVAYLAWMLASWKQVKEGFKDFYDEQLDKLCAELPSGSGIDAGVKLDRERSTKDKLVFTFGFHHMDEHGGYDVWTEHELIIKPDMAEGYSLTIKGRDRNMVKEYLYQLFGDVFYHSVQDRLNTFYAEKDLYERAHVGLHRNDFSYRVTAEGYTVYYKGKAIGGAGILGKSKARGKARMKDMEVYVQSAEVDINSLLEGNGTQHMMDAINKINEITSSSKQ